MTLFNIITGIVLFSYFSIAPGKASTSGLNNDLATAEEETAEYIPWSYDRMLTWKDFLCDPVRNTDAVALTSTSLGVSFKYNGGRFSYNISCNFAKKKSWGLMKTPYILAHEQAHFDISEIFARKLYQEMKNYHPKASTLKKDVSAIYDKIIKEEKAFQEQYDEETNHSRKKGRQHEWLEKIEQLLEETDAYANYP
ncbi:DUF922 domain-containing Zn-dependent protease [Chitinophagaceae bacterium LB-8]|uniref:DUF922 domain-containing Zn-dependent protease n=1 Tax=Paraflavisolibacter caeni TaxID=2982496 RepID=A0A9X3B7Q3_9BACT|nr:DUF922 domain-containing protein [Paraflavisolibacter caeni]MCU7548721.1 DUF922 domain-containing Zn-dependent protease [Paraflavisolibacter caeni]